MNGHSYAKILVFAGFLLAGAQALGGDTMGVSQDPLHFDGVHAPAADAATGGLEETPVFGTHLNGAWATPGVDAAGIMLEVMPDSGLLFFAWFTYPDPFYSDQWWPFSVATVPGYSDQRWITAYGRLPEVGITRVNLIYENSTGGGFDTDLETWPSWVARTDSEYGVGWLELLACDRFELHYDINGGLLVGTTEMVRLSPDGVAQCNELAEAGSHEQLR